MKVLVSVRKLTPRRRLLRKAGSLGCCNDIDKS